MDKEIQEMKCFVFRIAQQRWNVSPQKCAEIFDKCNAYDLIKQEWRALVMDSIMPQD